MLNKKQNEIFGGITKYDYEKNETIHYREKGYFYNEFYFIENNNPKTEDDGVLVGFMVDSKNFDSFFCAINSKDMTFLFKLKLPSRVPAGFHGLFIKNY
jgi:carotenoid cleavage dioxygenase-like enzyme